jgi:effector-binding domain-containing protein
MKASTEPTAAAFGPDGAPNFRVVEKQAQPVASIRIKCKPSEISEQLSILLPEVMAHLTATGAKMAGAPFSRYHSFGPDEIDLEAGIPVKQPIDEKGRIKNSELPAGKAVSCMHVGPYEQLSKAHEGLMQYAKQHELKQRGGQWEIYWTDPGMVPDPKKWRTELFLPIE